VSLGLIVTELIINAIKYAFPTNKAGAQVLVTYEVKGPDWSLVVSDNGVGKRADDPPRKSAGLGTAIVTALARQLEARVETTSAKSGMSVAVTRASFASNMPKAA
jgi:two-component sensor histidine kinase